MTVHWPLSPSKSTWMLPTKSGLCVEVGRVGAVPRAEGLLFLHGLESNPGSSLQTEEEAGLP